jgi:hypothetical protein
VGQPVAEVIRVPASEYLGFGLKTSESTSVDDTIPVTLEIVAVGMLRLGVPAAAGVLHAHRVVGEHVPSLVGEVSGCQSQVGSKVSRVGTSRGREYGEPYGFSDCSRANLTLADSSFFCTLARLSESTSGAIVLFHSNTARSQCAAANFRRPVL